MAQAKMTESKAQQVSKLVHWWIDKSEVSITFAPVIGSRKGLIVPEYNETFWLQGRQIAGKTLAMIIMSELMEMGSRYTIAVVYSCLCRMAWAAYVEDVEYVGEAAPVFARKPGRPKKPKAKAQIEMQQGDE